MKILETISVVSHTIQNPISIHFMYCVNAIAGVDMLHDRESNIHLYINNAGGLWIYI